MKVVLTKWNCGECDNWFNQKVVPDAMNEVVCPECKNRHLLFISQKDADKITYGS